MKKILTLIFISTLTHFTLAQNPNPALIGYWQNWNDSQCPYIQLTKIDTSYNIIPVAFAVPAPGTTYNITFTPDGITQLTLIKQIDTMHMRGKKVIISIGGANDPVQLNDTNQRNTFISSVTSIINAYSFDGIDIDFEGSSLSVSGGTIANPVDAKIINLIYAVRKIMDNFRQHFGKKMILTMAPETAFVTGGMSAYAGIWGAYLPVISALRDSIEVLQVQLYNSGSMYGIDGKIYFESTCDFILSQTEAVIHGFSTSGGYFNGLRADQVAVGLPACSNAAGGGYMSADSVKAAVKYLKGDGPKPASYSCLQSYPGLRGMMDWSVNWDAVATCGPVYEFANNFNSIFRTAKTLNLTLYIQGLYSSVTHNMKADTVRVYLRDTIAPYTVADSAIAYVSASGNASYTFTKAQSTKRYYIQTRQRNSIDTWSKAGGEQFSSSVLNYSFATSSSQAFGSNEIQIDTSPVAYGLYSGDVNHSGTVDLTDIVQVNNDAGLFLTGYRNSDLNGDSIVNLSDLTVAFNNSQRFVRVITP